MWEVHAVHALGGLSTATLPGQDMALAEAGAAAQAGAVAGILQRQAQAAALSQDLQAREKEALLLQALDELERQVRCAGAESSVQECKACSLARQTSGQDDLIFVTATFVS